MMLEPYLIGFIGEKIAHIFAKFLIFHYKNK